MLTREKVNPGYTEIIDRYLSEVGDTLAKPWVGTINRVVELLEGARRVGRSVFIFGNGGSAATASHFACDLAKGAICSGKSRLRAVALTDNVPLLSAWANDADYQDVFAEQLANLAEPGDIVIAISGSGNSRNVLEGVRMARDLEATTIGLIGFDGGRLKEQVDIALVVPNNSMEQVEDIHLLIGHIVATCLREGPRVTGNRAVFLDRDGTIARDAHYCRRPEDLETLPNVPDAIRLLNASGFKTVVVTNQSGIARGYFTEETLAEIHRKMEDELREQGALIDAIYYCPHHPDEGCDCRKPGTALFRRAARGLNIDLSSSFVVGDMAMDIEAGKALGCRTVLVNGGNGAGSGVGDGSPDYIADGLFEAVQWILNGKK